jgi:hypothetical protein
MDGLRNFTFSSSSAPYFFFFGPVACDTQQTAVLDTINLRSSFASHWFLAAVYND